MRREAVKREAVREGAVMGLKRGAVRRSVVKGKAVMEEVVRREVVRGEAVVEMRTLLVVVAVGGHLNSQFSRLTLALEMETCPWPALVRLSRFSLFPLVYCSSSLAEDALPGSWSRVGSSPLPVAAVFHLPRWSLLSFSCVIPHC